jgi:hypothetical protein
MISPGSIKENKDGFVYVRGYSPTPKKGDISGHAVVWIRAGIRKIGDPVFYFRCIIHSLDRAVADNLRRSHNHVGKFNVVFDAAHFHLSMIPPFGAIKRAVTMLQDHFPDRLGAIFLANLSRPAEVVVNLVKSIITKEVRDKIFVLPHDPAKRLAMLEPVVVPEFIPEYLGGNDTFRFDPTQYYPQKHQWSDEEAKKYLEIPYYSS